MRMKMLSILAVSLGLAVPVVHAANDKTNKNIDDTIAHLQKCITALNQLNKDAPDFKKYAEDQITNLKELKTVPQDQLAPVMAKYKADMWRQAKDKIKADIKAYETECAGITGDMKSLIAK